MVMFFHRYCNEEKGRKRMRLPGVEHGSIAWKANYPNRWTTNAIDVLYDLVLKMFITYDKQNNGKS